MNRFASALGNVEHRSSGIFGGHLTRRQPGLRFVRHAASRTARPSLGSKAQTFLGQANPAMLSAVVPGYDSAVTQGPRRGLLWSQLRESTRGAHAQAEASLAPLAQPESLAGYAALLCVFGVFRHPWSDCWATRNCRQRSIGRRGKRLNSLAADLIDLGVSDAPLPEAAGLPALSSPGAVWGTLYVTEGATLGGRALRRHIEARLGPVPVRFLDGHGDRTQPMWRDLAQRADQCVTTKHDRQLAQRTAMQAFAAFSTWCGTPHIASGLTFGFSESL